MTRKTHRYLTIDTDAHCGMPLDLFDRYLDPDIRKHPDAPRFVQEADGVTVFRCGTFQFPRRPPPKPGAGKPNLTPSATFPGPRGGWDPNHRIESFQDAEGIDRAVCMPFGVMFPSYVQDRALGNALSQAWNDWLADFCRTHPSRIFGYGVINIADPQAAARELRRCVKELGFPSVVVAPSAVGRKPEDYYILADEALYPIWDEAQSLGVPISIHSFPDPYVPGHEFNGPRRPTGLWDAIGFPTASMNLFGNLVLGGVCESFPKLRFGMFECTIGWIPQLLHGIHEYQENFGEYFTRAVPKMKLTAKEYLQRQLYFSVEVDDPFIRTFIEWTGAPQNLLYASDYPHLEYHPGQIDKLLARADLSDEEKRGILGANALEYFCWRDTAMPAVTERPAAA
ncbi:MAG: amidohydrolase family protein [Steroidobacteraceae bacterium]